MYTIKELILERQQYPLAVKGSPWKDELMPHILEDEGSEIAFITIGSTLLRKKEREALEDKYYVIGIYHLGSIFTNISVPFYILHLSRMPSTGIKFSVFYGQCFKPQKGDRSRPAILTPDKYYPEWEEYVTKLEKWMNGAEKPENNDHAEFNYISRKELFHDSLFPETYTKENVRIRELLDKQDTRPLSDFAEIITPRVDHRSNEKVKVLTVRAFEYPFDIQKARESVPTNVVLQNEDIVVPKVQTNTIAYLFHYDGEERVYASPNMMVIRCRDISPEYLYLYLNSEIAIKALNARRVGSFFKQLPLTELNDFPIAKPERAAQEYTSFFHGLVSEEVRQYEKPERIAAFIEGKVSEEELKEKAEVVEDILNIEIANKIKAHNEEQLRAFLTDDLKELNACFNVKAYKATLILAGSILEAVLIDWLSEIKGRNLFEEEYYVRDRRNGREKRADLIDYIDEIKYIERPRWMEEARKAHEIRKKRNLVHAKLCLASDEINENVCRQVIDYLADVLRTRGVNR